MATSQGPTLAQLNLMNYLFKHVELLEAVPESASWNGGFDFISVHSAAATILQAVRAQYAGTDVAVITYSYQAGEMVYLLQLVRELADGGAGLLVKSVPMGKWVEKAEQRGFNLILAACLWSVTEGGISLAFPRLVQAGHK
jgi:hypothetical protein